MYRVTLERARELLDYSPATGEFTWKQRRSSRSPIGGIAGTAHNCGYWQIQIDRKLHLAHRLAWLLQTGQWPTCEVDHINGIPSDNRWSNLREATHTENMWNIKVPATNTSGYLGVSWDVQAGKWRASIRIAGKKKVLGLFRTPEAAALAYSEAAVKSRGVGWGRRAGGSDV